MHHPSARPPPSGGPDQTTDEGPDERRGTAISVDHLRAARLCVATHAVDTHDARVLLDMLGLLHPDHGRDDDPADRVQPHHPGAPRMARP